MRLFQSALPTSFTRRSSSSAGAHCFAAISSRAFASLSAAGAAGAAARAGAEKSAARAAGASRVAAQREARPRATARARLEFFMGFAFALELAVGIDHRTYGAGGDPDASGNETV